MVMAPWRLRAKRSTCRRRFLGLASADLVHDRIENRPVHGPAGNVQRAAPSDEDAVCFGQARVASSWTLGLMNPWPDLAPTLERHVA